MRTGIAFRSEEIGLGGMAAALYAAPASTFDIEAAAEVAEIEDIASEAFELHGFDRFVRGGDLDAFLDGREVDPDRVRAAELTAECWRHQLDVAADPRADVFGLLPPAGARRFAMLDAGVLLDREW